MMRKFHSLTHSQFAWERLNIKNRYSNILFLNGVLRIYVKTPYYSISRCRSATPKLRMYSLFIDRLLINNIQYWALRGPFVFRKYIFKRNSESRIVESLPAEPVLLFSRFSNSPGCFSTRKLVTSLRKSSKFRIFGSSNISSLFLSISLFQPITRTTALYKNLIGSTRAFVYITLLLTDCHTVVRQSDETNSRRTW